MESRRAWGWASAAQWALRSARSSARRSLNRRRRSAGLRWGRRSARGGRRRARLAISVGWAAAAVGAPSVGEAAVAMGATPGVVAVETGSARGCGGGGRRLYRR
ncbi:MAG: hypothetical protein WKH64_07420 [Chloroflexia bacterium]